MITKKFQRDYLLDVLDLPENAIEDKIYENTRWSIFHKIVFEDLDGSIWKTTYSVGATEMQPEGPWEYDGDEITCIQVEEMVVPVTKFLPVLEEGDELNLIKDFAHSLEDLLEHYSSKGENYMKLTYTIERALSCIDADSPYRWHDLRRDENDVPEVGSVVLCKLSHPTYMHGEYMPCKYIKADKYSPTDYFEWDKNGFPEVVAWKYIDKFE